MKRLTASTAGLACVLATVALVPTAAAPGVRRADASVFPASAPLPPARVAFTDDRDELALQRLVREELPDGSEDPPSDEPFRGYETAQTVDAGSSTRHEAEAGVQIGVGGFAVRDRVAFVSTRAAAGSDDPDGEVFVGGMADGEHDLRVRVPVTCDNDARESHPQLVPGGTTVLYASNIITESSPQGDWELYLATEEEDEGVLNRLPAAPRTGGACGDWQAFQLTDNADDDLWPSWVGVDRIVYSSTRSDPLGDIWELTVDDGEVVADVQQTDGEAAETQPVPVTLGNMRFVFTTTQFRPDGSLGYVTPTQNEPNPVSSLWGPGTAPQQSSEAAWAAESRNYLAFTSTEDDPYGDVWVTTLVGNVEPSFLRVGGQSHPVADRPGVAESHATWRNVFDDDPSDDPIVINRPAPFGQGPRLGSLALDDPPDAVDQDEYAELIITRRSIDADISDVVASDGSDRTVRIARQVDVDGTLVDVDDAGPAYSPDGERLAFSSARQGFMQGRDLMVAAADGTGAQSLAALTGNGRDVDVDPVWSPDGTRLAFTRYPFQPDPEFPSYGAPQTWVVDIEGEPDNAFPVTEPPGSGPVITTHYDTDPTWSRDGEVLVVSRSSTISGEIGRAARAGPRQSPFEAELVALEAVRAGRVAEITYDSCDDGCIVPVPGRSPAWSPDGTDIVYDDRGALRVLRVDPVGPSDAEFTAGTWRVDSARVLTGFGDDGFDPAGDTGDATPSRARVSVAEDPAWSEDGTEIVFAGQPAGLPDQRGIWSIARDGSGVRVITDEPGPETEPAWQPRPEADLAVTVTVLGSPADVGDPVLATYTLANLGPSTAYDVTLTTTTPPGGDAEAASPPSGCAADGSGCTRDALASGESLTYEVTLSWPDPVSAEVVGEATSRVHDPDLTNNVDRARIDVVEDLDADLAVRLRMPRLGWVGGEQTGRVVVVNRGPVEADDVDLRVRLPRSVDPTAGDTCLVDEVPCALGTLLPGDRTVLPVTLMMTNPDRVDVSRTPVRARVSATTPDPEPADNRDRSPIRVLQPAVRLLPEVARPGMVVLAYGERMPPRSRVRLRWTRGITVSSGPYRVARDGTLQHPILIVRRDQLAERKIRAISVGTEFGTVRGPLLVTPRTMMAPDFRGRG